MPITEPSQIFQLDTATPQSDSLFAFQVNDGSTEAQKCTTDAIRVAMNLGTVPLTVKVSLTSAEILALNTTPKTLIAAGGTGTVIVPISILCNFTYGTTTYATFTSGRFKFFAISGNIASNSIIGSVSNIISIQPIVSTSFSTLPINTAFIYDISSGNPTTGDGTLDIYITYCLVTL